MSSRVDEIRRLQADNERLQAEKVRLEKWVADLQSGAYINCVYCGFRFGPADTMAESLVSPTADRPCAAAPTQAELLRQHIAECEHHPMARLVKAALQAESVLNGMLSDWGDRTYERDAQMARDELAAAIAATRPATPNHPDNTAGLK